MADASPSSSEESCVSSSIRENRTSSIDTASTVTTATDPGSMGAQTSDVEKESNEVASPRRTTRAQSRKRAREDDARSSDEGHTSDGNGPGNEGTNNNFHQEEFWSKGSNHEKA